MARTMVKWRGISEDPGAFDIIYAKQYTTVGGAAAEVIKIRGVEKSDVAIVIAHTTTTQAISTVACGKNQVTVTFADNPSTTHVINLWVIRPRRKEGAKHRVY